MRVDTNNSVRLHPCIVVAVCTCVRLKDESLEDSENLPAPEVIAQDIAENLEAALEQFSSIHEDLETD